MRKGLSAIDANDDTSLRRFNYQDACLLPEDCKQVLQQLLGLPLMARIAAALFTRQPVQLREHSGFRIVAHTEIDRCGAMHGSSYDIVHEATIAKFTRMFPLQLSTRKLSVRIDLKAMQLRVGNVRPKDAFHFAAYLLLLNLQQEQWSRRLEQ